jgi:glycine betaine/proline transport system substrate-binding protein
MVRVEVPAYDEEAHGCNGDVDCANPRFSAYPAAKVVTAVSGAFMEREPDVAELLKNVAFTNAQMGDVLAWRLDNNASYDEAAVYFLTQKANWPQSSTKSKKNRSRGPKTARGILTSGRHTYGHLRLAL